jgi:hypothetical protein
MRHTNQPTNHERATRCHWALEVYGNDSLETNLVDILCDAMHWSDLNGQEFHFLLASACRHYINELNDEQTQRTRIS